MLSDFLEDRRSEQNQNSRYEKEGKWNQESLRTALNKILTKELNLRKASVRYNIPKSTLHDKASALKRGE